jgi:hypothetical protein
MDDRFAERTSQSLMSDCLRAVARNLGGDDLCELRRRPPAFVWLFGSTIVEASIDGEGRVLLRAFLVHEPRAIDEIATDLALFTAGLRIGQLSLDDDGDVVMSHRVPASEPPERVARQVERFCQEADRLDDIVSARWCGSRALDRLQATVIRALRMEPGAFVPN